jgi:hypothetical protein
MPAAVEFEGDRDPYLATCPIGSSGLVRGSRRLL